MRRVILCVPVVIVSLAVQAFAEDWAQWRGPERNGVVKNSPPLVDGFPKAGPKKLWQSENIAGAMQGGWGSVTVADGKAYVYANGKIDVPVKTRTLTGRGLAGLGYSPKPLPENLAAALKKARLSEERAALANNQLNKWIQKWIKENLADKKLRRFQGVVHSRLREGAGMLGEDILNKLGKQVGREKVFETEEALIAWLKENGLDEAGVKRLVKISVKKRIDGFDTVLCVNAADGKTLWKYEEPGRAYAWPCSSTPCVVDGRCYVQISNGFILCLDAVSGKEIWKVQSKARQHGGTSSSFVVEQGVAVLLAGPLTGFDPKTGKEIWTQPKVKGEYASAAYYRTGGKTYLVASGNIRANKGETYCVDPKDGRILWSVPEGGWGTPTIVGDWMVMLCWKTKPGLVAYRLSAEGANEIWSIPFADRGASVLIHQGAVYALAGGGKAKAMCVDLATGRVHWEQKIGGTEFSSPVGVGDKVVAVVGATLYLLKADTAKMTVLGQANMGIMGCTSPTLADGILYLRHNEQVAAYDLRKPPEVAAADAK